MVLKEDGNLTSFKFLQPEKQQSGIVSIPSGISIDSIAASAKANSPIVFSVDGNLTEFNLLHK